MSSSQPLSLISPHSKTDDEIVDVQLFLLIKKIVDGNDGGCDLVGTMIQNVGRPHIKQFEMRFNEESNEGFATPRNEGSSTYQLRVPLVFQVELDTFPFRITKATATIELSSLKMENYSIRPNLLLNKKDRRNMVAIQELKGAKNVESKLDHCCKYSFVSPYPEVRFLYDNKKNYCPKYEVSFYLTESGIAKLLKVTLPMALIATMNSINVILMSREAIDDSDYLGNAASLALTAVLLLSDIVSPQPQKEKVFSLNTGYIIMIFIGLIWSSIPSSMSPDVINLPLYGMYIVWLSFAFPLLNALIYSHRFNKIVKKMNRINKNKPFLKDDNYSPSKIDDGSFFPASPEAHKFYDRDNRRLYSEPDKNETWHKAIEFA